MENKSFLVLLISLFAVTYSTRVLPVFALRKIKFSKKAELFLNLIPITSMSALIFPSVLYADPSYISIGLFGGAAAALSAWLRLPVIVSLLISIVVCALCYEYGILF